MRQHPAGRLHHRLHDHRADPRPVDRQQRPQLVQHLHRTFSTRLPRRQHTRAGHHPRLDQQRTVRRVEQLDTAHRHRAERVTVIALGDMDVQRAVLTALRRRLVRHLDRRLRRGRAIAGEEHLRKPGRRHPQQLLRQPDTRLVRQTQERRMIQPLQLLPHRRVHRRLTVPVNSDPQRGHPVEITATVGVPEMDTGPPVDHQRPVGRPRRMLGERMPHRGEVTGDEVGSRGDEVGSRHDAQSRSSAVRRRPVGPARDADRAAPMQQTASGTMRGCRTFSGAERRSCRTGSGWRTACR